MEKYDRRSRSEISACLWPTFEPPPAYTLANLRWLRHIVLLVFISCSTLGGSSAVVMGLRRQGHPVVEVEMEGCETTEAEVRFAKGLLLRRKSGGASRGRSMGQAAESTPLDDAAASGGRCGRLGRGRAEQAPAADSADARVPFSGVGVMLNVVGIYVNDRRDPQALSSSNQTHDERQTVVLELCRVASYRRGPLLGKTALSPRYRFGLPDPALDFSASGSCGGAGSVGYVACRDHRWQGARWSSWWVRSITAVGG